MTAYQLELFELRTRYTPISDFELWLDRRERFADYDLSDIEEDES